MRVLVTGAESSGTNLVTALLASRGVTAVHRSVPAGVEWLLPAGPWDAILVCHRHGPITARSQTHSGHADTEREALAKLARGYALVYSYAQLAGCMVIPVSYEALVHEAGSVGLVLDLLELPRTESPVRIRDANAKWYGGPRFSDHRAAGEMH